MLICGATSPNAAVFTLRILTEIGQPLREEGGRLEIQAGGFHEHLGVTGPAGPLVTLRAVGGDIEEVPLLAPDRVFDQLVDQWLRAGECAGARQIGIDDDPSDIARWAADSPSPVTST